MNYLDRKPNTIIRVNGLVLAALSIQTLSWWYGYAKTSFAARLKASKLAACQIEDPALKIEL